MHTKHQTSASLATDKLHSIIQIISEHILTRTSTLLLLEYCSKMRYVCRHFYFLRHKHLRHENSPNQYIQLVMCSRNRASVHDVNPLDPRGNHSATSNNMKLVHWPLMGGLLHLVQRGGAWAGWGPAQSPPRCTKCKCCKAQHTTV